MRSGWRHPVRLRQGRRHRGEVRRRVRSAHFDYRLKDTGARDQLRDGVACSSLVEGGRMPCACEGSHSCGCSPGRVIRADSLLWLYQLIRAARAFFEALQQSGTCHVFPVLCLGEQLPTSIRMIRGTLSAERSHCAHAAYSFHSDLPCLFARIGMLCPLRRYGLRTSPQEA
jgi:hypothetical protein